MPSYKPYGEHEPKGEVNQYKQWIWTGAKWVEILSTVAAVRQIFTYFYPGLGAGLTIAAAAKFAFSTLRTMQLKRISREWAARFAEAGIIAFLMSRKPEADDREKFINNVGQALSEKELVSLFTAQRKITDNEMQQFMQELSKSHQKTLEWAVKNGIDVELVTSATQDFGNLFAAANAQQLSPQVAQFNSNLLGAKTNIQSGIKIAKQVSNVGQSLPLLASFLGLGVLSVAQLFLQLKNMQDNAIIRKQLEKLTNDLEEFRKVTHEHFNQLEKLIEQNFGKLTKKMLDEFSKVGRRFDDLERMIEREFRTVNDQILQLKKTVVNIAGGIAEADFQILRANIDSGMSLNEQDYKNNFLRVNAWILELSSNDNLTGANIALSSGEGVNRNKEIVAYLAGRALESNLGFLASLYAWGGSSNINLSFYFKSLELYQESREKYPEFEAVYGKTLRENHSDTVKKYIGRGTRVWSLIQGLQKNEKFWWERISEYETSINAIVEQLNKNFDNFKQDKNAWASLNARYYELRALTELAFNFGFHHDHLFRLLFTEGINPEYRLLSGDEIYALIENFSDRVVERDVAIRELFSNLKNNALLFKELIHDRRMQIQSGKQECHTLLAASLHEFAKFAKDKKHITDADLVGDLELPRLDNLPQERAAADFLQNDIFHAVRVGSVSLVKDNIKDINRRDELGRTPLHYAVSEGELEIVGLLLERNADPTARDRWDNTPAHLFAKGLTKNRYRYNQQDLKDLLSIARLLKETDENIKHHRDQKIIALLENLGPEFRDIKQVFIGSQKSLPIIFTGTVLRKVKEKVLAHKHSRGFDEELWMSDPKLPNYVIIYSQADKKNKTGDPKITLYNPQDLSIYAEIKLDMLVGKTIYEPNFRWRIHDFSNINDGILSIHYGFTSSDSTGHHSVCRQFFQDFDLAKKTLLPSSNYECTSRYGYQPGNLLRIRDRYFVTYATPIRPRSKLSPKEEWHFEVFNPEHASLKKFPEKDSYTFRWSELLGNEAYFMMYEAKAIAKGPDACLVKINLDTLDLKEIIKFPTQVSAPCCFNKANRTIWFYQNNQVMGYDLITGNICASLPGHYPHYPSMYFDVVKMSLAIIGQDNKLTRWSLAKPVPEKLFEIQLALPPKASHQFIFEGKALLCKTGKNTTDTPEHSALYEVETGQDITSICEPSLNLLPRGFTYSCTTFGSSLVRNRITGNLAKGLSHETMLESWELVSTLRP